MPELPEVEVIARGLDRTLHGRSVITAEVPGLTRLSECAETLVPKTLGRTFARVYRRAKVLLIEMDDGSTMAFHLKMTGRVVHGPRRPVHKHDRILFMLDDGTQLTFSDMRKFGYVCSFTPQELEDWDFLAKVGPEPLETSPEDLAGRIKGRNTAVKGLLLNQSVVAGVGNIYADESLFRAGIHPQTKGSRIGKDRAVRLFTELQAVLQQAINENGSSISDYVNAHGDAGAFQNSFNVYGRKGQKCKECGSTLQAVKVAGRTSTFCPECQSKR
ncbi:MULTISPECIES: bifunctional DNA-formamidopyrimidine glycosylase/DNA-(apurinic or apyrimidinic site) lyase [unclassified Pseudodesulfovibrio]|uniref:bifunctional DNA-formamidopyrimidine glycosylase/DNA-(apurinic or apyrimidinic site) lyase n=1 Tax=unclassified Pseudodesulfovibrio TaxID=2661612 RepID=UPI000FEBD9DB|nr:MULTISPECIES: bifunctional DNA-formamidopyrimidine glycosylase/DNA-(apurinic or apyrimidinic site) lyase [unclassified Pseudodesulfovibrio]MCJ2165216.1 bifunctional DNA-formamidopyrimidine glycosylase/DNA-(apurinic or apyrimidinic site) lyase [Pseudodesulfovibrio sp. S3-i]RWU03271.1 bifunctional DNA-formamidopyrimidine glycosylase/DNA-(apurinic or apyrimidinic site) lyase [Pseudodesulfovibrio sp. S3]